MSTNSPMQMRRLAGELSARITTPTARSDSRSMTLSASPLSRHHHVEHPFWSSAGEAYGPQGRKFQTSSLASYASARELALEQGGRGQRVMRVHGS